jgi:hypothetical protein
MLFYSPDGNYNAALMQVSFSCLKRATLEAPFRALEKQLE